MCTILLVVVISVLAYLIFDGYYQDKKDYNNGVCPKCKGKYTYQGCTKDGNPIYMCNDCGHTIVLTFYNPKKI